MKNYIKRNKIKDLNLPDTQFDITAMPVNENSTLAWILNPETPKVPVCFASNVSLTSIPKNSYSSVASVSGTDLYLVVNTVFVFSSSICPELVLYLNRSGTRYKIGYSSGGYADSYHPLFSGYMVLTGSDTLEIFNNDDPITGQVSIVGFKEVRAD